MQSSNSDNPRLFFRMMMQSNRLIRYFRLIKENRNPLWVLLKIKLRLRPWCLLRARKMTKYANMRWLMTLSLVIIMMESKICLLGSSINLWRYLSRPRLKLKHQGKHLEAPMSMKGNWIGLTTIKTEAIYRTLTRLTVALLAQETKQMIQSTSPSSCKAG